MLWWWRESGGWDCVCEGPDEFNFLISEMASLVALFLVSEMHLFLFVYFVYIVTFCQLITPKFPTTNNFQYYCGSVSQCETSARSPPLQKDFQDVIVASPDLAGPARNACLPSLIKFIFRPKSSRPPCGGVYQPLISQHRLTFYLPPLGGDDQIASLLHLRSRYLPFLGHLSKRAIPTHLVPLCLFFKFLLLGVISHQQPVSRYGKNAENLLPRPAAK